MLSTGLEDPEVLQDFNSIFIEAVCLGQCHHWKYKKLLKEVRAFFIKCAKYLQTLMPVLKNDVIKPFPCLPERHQATLDKLHVLLDQSEQVNLDF